MPVFAVEAKVGKAPPFVGAIRQAIENASPGEVPVAIIRRNEGGNRKPTDVAVLRLDDFYQLVAEWWEACGRDEHVSDETMEIVGRTMDRARATIGKGGR